MQITVLGNCGPYPRAGGACSGYLLEHEGTKILIDCGNGTLSRLLQLINTFEEIDAILISHLHSDHMADAMVLRYGVGIHRAKGLISKSIPLYASAAPREDFDKLQFQEAFEMKEIEDNLAVHIKGLKIYFKRMEHSLPSYGVVIQSDNKKFVYSGDTRYCNQILEISEGADLFLCECGVLERDKTKDTTHLSAREAGEIAQRSNVKKLLLTHFWPGYDLNDIYEEAKKTFEGDLVLSEQMNTYEI